MREKLQQCLLILVLIGITPACAGKTPPHLSTGLMCWDHPRVCGKNFKPQFSIKISAGSPPRLREKPFLCLLCIALDRITPACAGKTHSGIGRPFCMKDHPRVCGKNLPPWNTTTHQTGSPPRVREKHMQTYSSPGYNRITPACAGKTIEDIPNRFSMGDHPRVCGKNVNHCYRHSVFSGSPPRVREKLTPIVSTVVATRITPACAGKTD